MTLQFIKNLRNAIQQLRNFPYKFPLVQDEYLKQQEIRCMPYKNYYIFYEVIENVKMVIVIKICKIGRNLPWHRRCAVPLHPVKPDCLQ